ncbi:MAG: hypothetical protein ACR5LG_07010 [Sodalis sp. (in: enterobacteria)]|uniref:hypothetical protein n=1 Tax=Sodalis sp. (in: enterobacteria) TaxID=1898979 RepID=UPI003F353F3F
MPTSIDRHRKSIGNYHNDLQTSHSPKSVKRSRGSSVGKCAHRDNHSGYHKAMANIFILALLSVQLQLS